MAGEMKRATLIWEEAFRFRGGQDGGSGSDVVSILKKMRVPLSEFRIEMSGERRETEPRRYVSIHFVYHLRGQGLDEQRARRAIDLSLEKYCSVIHSLASDITVSYALSLA